MVDKHSAQPLLRSKHNLRLTSPCWKIEIHEPFENTLEAGLVSDLNSSSRKLFFF